MNFFAQQAKARANTGRLILLFAAAVLLIVVAMNLVVLVGATALIAAEQDRPGGAVDMQAWYATLSLWTTGLTLLIIVGGSLYKVASLSGGGRKVAEAFGGTLVKASASDPMLVRLRNVVEEMAIASGVPMPALYVLEDQPAINAFAAGTTPANAAIAVTRGCLDRLTRDELQGVVAHEFSHVLNGDMRLNIKLMGVIFGILALQISGQHIIDSVWHVRRSSKDEGGVRLALGSLGLGMIIVGFIGVIFGRLIKAAVSRQREFLADASAVQFTRLGAGLAGALKKIGGLEMDSSREATPYSSRFTAAGDEEISHMLFGSGFSLSGLFATHPPVLERIQAIEPGFRPEQWNSLKHQWAEAENQASQASADEAVQHLSAGPAEAPVTPPVTPAGAAPDVVAAVGTINSASIDNALKLRKRIPQALWSAAHDADDALALLLAQLIDVDAELARRQLQLVGASWGRPVAERVQNFARELQAVARDLYLPLAAVAFAPVRQRPRAELFRLKNDCTLLSLLDGQLSCFEFALGHMLKLQITEVMHPQRARTMGRKSLMALSEDVAILLSILVGQGHTDPRAAQAAFAKAARRALPMLELRFAPPANWSTALDESLSRLNSLSPMAKERLLSSLSIAIMHDERITLEEFELLRAVCASLHCQLPPLQAA